MYSIFQEIPYQEIVLDQDEAFIRYKLYSKLCARHFTSVMPLKFHESLGHRHNYPHFTEEKAKANKGHHIFS